MVGTFLDSGRTRPSLREALNLVVHGMRTHLGRPESRAVVVGAVLTSILCGLFAAAGATRLAWETAYPLPAKEHAAAVVDGALPTWGLGDRLRRDSSTLVPEDGETDARYHFGAWHGQLNGRVTSDRPALAKATRERLLAQGWQVSGPHLSPHSATLQARRGADLLEISMWLETGREGTNLVVSLSRSTPWAVHAAGWAAGLLGVLAGWLVFGWASRRMAVRPWAQAFARFFWLIALAFACLPVVWRLVPMAQSHLRDRPLRWRPLWEWLGEPDGRILLTLAGACAVLALVFACSPTRPRPAKLIPWTT